MRVFRVRVLRRTTSRLVQPRTRARIRMRMRVEDVGGDLGRGSGSEGERAVCDVGVEFRAGGGA